LILTNNELIPKLTQITVAQITTTLRGNDAEVWLDESDGMIEGCAINLTNLKIVPKEKIGVFITHLSEEKMNEVFEAVKFALGFDK
jgi:mRNA interferase MazF